MKNKIRFPENVLLLAKNIKIVFFDIDGVMTDGGIYYTESGETIKRFNTLDGQGIKQLQRAGIIPAVVTGRDSLPLRTRLKALGIVHARFGTEDKKPAAKEILEELKLDWNDSACVGDDWPDLPLFKMCSLAITTPGAHIEALNRANYITKLEAGNGAVREVADLLLIANNKYENLLNNYLNI